MTRAASKILFVVADGNPGGGTTLVLDMLKTLTNTSCSLITQRDSYALETSRCMGISAEGINFFSSRLDLRISFHLKKLINRLRPDLIHIHGGRAAFFSSFISLDVPTIYTVHGLHALYYGSGPIRFLSKLAERKSMKAAQRVVFVSQSERNVAKKAGILSQSNDQVILNGIQFDQLPKKKAHPKKLGFVGRFCEQKDPLFLIEVMRILAREGFTLSMIGGGELEDVVKQKVKAYHLENVITMTGKLSHEEALKAMSRTEVLLMPSRWEAFGLVAVEAMALGIPVVASQLPPLEEIIQNDRTGILISSKDPKEYAHAIRQLYKDPERRHHIELAAQKDVFSRFGWEMYMKSYENLYQELLG